MKFWGTILILGWCVARSKADWDEKSPLFLNKKGDTYSFPRRVSKKEGSDIIQYLASEEIGDATTQIFCPSDDSKDGTTLISRGNLDSCSKPVKPIMERELVENNGRKKPVSCGLSEEENGFRYKVYYKLVEVDPGRPTTLGKKIPMHLYNFCLDENMKQILYAEYTIDSPQLLDNSILQDEQNHKFQLVPYNDDGGVVKGFYEQNPYNEPRTVGVTEFMPFAHMRKAFHLYDSSTSVNGELLEVWNNFMLKIRAKISKKTERIKVFSGIYDRKRIHGTSQYLNGELIPSPYAWWALLYNEKQTAGVSLIMHNYAFNVTEDKHELLCNRDLCIDVGVSDDDLPDPQAYKYALVYCCPASAITDLYPFPEVEHLFNLDGE